MAYLFGKISMVRAIVCIAIATQCFIGADILYSAFMPTLKDNRMVILINMLILSGNMFSRWRLIRRVSHAGWWE